MRTVRNGGACGVVLLSVALAVGCAPGPRYELSTDGRSGKDFQAVVLRLDDSQPPEEAITVEPDPVTIRWENRPNRVVWVIPEKDLRDEWVITWKGPESGSGVNYFPTPVEKVIRRGPDDAYLVSVPCPEMQTRRGAVPAARQDQDVGDCVPPPAGESVQWYYSIRVERDFGGGKTKVVGSYDPRFDITYP